MKTRTTTPEKKPPGAKAKKKPLSKAAKPAKNPMKKGPGKSPSSSSSSPLSPKTKDLKTPTKNAKNTSKASPSPATKTPKKKDATKTSTPKTSATKKMVVKKTPDSESTVKSTPGKKATTKKANDKDKDSNKKTPKKTTKNTPEPSSSSSSSPSSSTSSSPTSTPTTPAKKVKNTKNTPKSETKSIPKVAKKNSIAKRRKSRVASLDASAKMKILTETSFTKNTTTSSTVDTSKEEPKVKKEIKTEPSNESSTSTPKETKKTSTKMTPKAGGSKSEAKTDGASKKAVGKTKKLTPKSQMSEKKISMKKKILKKKKKPKRRNELGDSKTEVFDTKVFKRIASLNASAIMAATSIAATSLAGRKPIDHSDDSDEDGEEEERVQDQPIPPTSSHVDSGKSSKVLPTSSFSPFVPVSKGSSQQSSSTSPNVHSPQLTKSGKPKKIKSSENGSLKNSSKSFNHLTDHLSSPKSAFSPCSPPHPSSQPQKPEVIRAGFVQPAAKSSTGSSRTDGSTIKVPKPKKIKVQTIHLDNIRENPTSTASTTSSSRFAGVPVNNSASRQPTGSAFAQPIPTAVPSSTSSATSQPQPIPFAFPFYPQPTSFSMPAPPPPPQPVIPQPQPGPIPINLGFPHIPVLPSFVYTPVQQLMSPFGHSHLHPHLPPAQPLLSTSPFTFQPHRPVTSTTSMFGTPTSSFLYQNGTHDPNIMFRSPFQAPQPMHQPHVQPTAHHHPMGRSSFHSGIFPMSSSSSMPFTMSGHYSTAPSAAPMAGPSNTTSVTIEEIHDESGEVDDVTIIPIVVQAPSDDDRSSLPSGSPRKKVERTKTKSKISNGSSSSSAAHSKSKEFPSSSHSAASSSRTSVNKHNDQFEGNRTAAPKSSSLSPSLSVSKSSSTSSKPLSTSSGPTRGEAGSGKGRSTSYVDISIRPIHIASPVNGSSSLKSSLSPSVSLKSGSSSAGVSPSISAKHRTALPVPVPSTAKKKRTNATDNPNVIEIVLDNPDNPFHKLAGNINRSSLMSPININLSNNTNSNTGPKNGSHRATEAVIFNPNNNLLMKVNHNIHNMANNSNTKLLNSNNGNNNGSNSKKGIYHGWSWLGEPTYKEVFLSNNDEKTIQKCFPAIRHLEGDIIRVRDCVLLKSGTKKNDLPFVAKIAALWEAPGDEMFMSLLWFYRPEQLEVKGESFPGELFASRHKDVNSVACIEDRCFVLTYNQWCRYKAMRRRLVNQLIIRPPALESLDPKSKRFPLLNTEPEMVFYSSRVYDYRQKKILKSGKD